MPDDLEIYIINKIAESTTFRIQINKINLFFLQKILKTYCMHIQLDFRARKYLPGI